MSYRTSFLPLCLIFGATVAVAPPASAGDDLEDYYDDLEDYYEDVAEAREDYLKDYNRRVRRSIRRGHFVPQAYHAPQYVPAPRAFYGGHHGFGSAGRTVTRYYGVSPYGAPAYGYRSYGYSSHGSPSYGHGHHGGVYSGGVYSGGVYSGAVHHGSYGYGYPVYVR